MVRIQLRRDTAANWTSSNPVLRAGEVGIETDTLKFKVGNGTSTWTQITAYANVTPTSLTSSLASYIESGDLGQPSGPAQLTAGGDLLVPENEIIMWSAATNTYTTTLAATQPTANRTITLKDGTGTLAFTSDIPSNTDSLSEGTTNKYFTDERAQDATATALANGSHTNITVTYNDNANSISLAAAPGYTDEEARDAVAGLITGSTHDGVSVSYTDSGTGVGTLAFTNTDKGSSQNIFKNIVVGATTVVADGNNDTLTIVGSNGVGALANAANDVIEIYNTGVTSLTGTANEVEVDTTTGAIVVGLPNDVTISGNLTLSTAPTQASHAVTKSYVDAAVNNVNIHEAVVAATTTNVSLGSGPHNNEVLDGVTLSTGNRILIKNQNTASQNGIYIVNGSGAPTRATDYDTAGEVSAGDFIFVQGGTVNANTGWVQTSVVNTVGTDSLSFTQFSGAGTYLAGTGLSLTGNTFAIDTATTVNLNSSQTLTNKTITGTFTGNLTGNVTGNVSGNAGTVTNGVYTNATNTFTNKNNFSPASALSDPIIDIPLPSGQLYPAILTRSNTSWITALNPTGLDSYWQARFQPQNVSTVPLYVKGLASQSANLQEWQNSSGAVLASINSSGALTTSGLTVGNVSNTEIGYLDGVTSAIQTQLDAKVAKSLVDAKGDLLVGTADNTVARIGIGTDGYLLTADSSTTEGLKWAAAPVSLPSQTGASGKYLTTDGTDASWGTLVVPISTGTVTVNQNTAQDVDSTALSAFTSIEYMISIKQGSKVRTSKVIMQTDGTSVDMTEFAITETGGTISGVVVSATTASSNGKLQVTVTNALSTNATVKFSKVAL